MTDDILADALDQRFKANQIYTYIGDIVVAVNPFQYGLGFYKQEISAQYCNIANKKDLPPHIYAVSDTAFQAMRRGNPQCCVISGESGAGKTESAKQFISQIMDVSARGVAGGGGGSSARAKHPVEGKIAAQNPILESYGNAQTVMNDNSSRFGKFIELMFSNSHTVQGANMSHYLLEKARVVMQGPGERNFHTFGLMFAGMTDVEKTANRLETPDAYRYLKAEPMDNLEQKVAEWKEMVEAFKLCGFTDIEKDQCFTLTAAVLHMGNLNFKEGENDAGEVDNNDVLDTISTLLMVKAERLKEAFCKVVVTMRGEVIVKTNSEAQCANARDASAKGLYERLFWWLVAKLNISLRPSKADMKENSGLSIGILDIFGFENFDVNGFDQMCINLANEQLHNFFNETIFADEIKAYIEEELDLSTDVVYHDNAPVLDMFFRHKPAGLLSLLDQQSSFDRATSNSLLALLNKEMKGDTLYGVVRGNYAFQVSHYAGDIKYNADGFLEKNRDPLPNLMPEVMHESSLEVLKVIFVPGFEAAMAAGESTRKMTMKRRKSVKVTGPKKKGDLKTVSAGFRVSLASLMAKMGACDPHFIRCIKPNPQKKPHLWDAEMVLRQLTYTGMLQTVQMRREGFPHRVKFVEFYKLYAGIVMDFTDSRLNGDPAEACTRLCQMIEVKAAERRKTEGLRTLTSRFSKWLIAKRVVFLKYWQLDLLGGMLLPFGKAALKIQAFYRGHMARKRYAVIKAKYEAMKLEVAQFLEMSGTRSDKLWSNLNAIINEEMRKGPVKLGIAPKPGQKPKAAPAPKVISEKKIAKQLAKAKRDMTKVKKKIVKWWIKSEERKNCHQNEEGEFYPWFHGVIGRSQADDYLQDRPEGSFLIRISEHAEGYALDFKSDGQVRHFKMLFDHLGQYKVQDNDEAFASLLELVQYFQKNPVTEDGEDVLTDPVPFQHDLGLHFDPKDVKIAKVETSEKKGGKVKRGGKMGKSVRHANADELAGRSKEPLSYELFLQQVDPMPSWWKGAIDRKTAEEQLQARGLAHGRFLVREKKRTPSRVELALTVCFERAFYHHLLERKVQGSWKIDGKEIDYNDTLEEVIEVFQKKKSHFLAGKLESDGPDMATTTMKKGKGGGGAAAPGVERPTADSSADDVAAWLVSVGMTQHIGVFFKAKFDGKKLLQASEKQLRKLMKSEDDVIMMMRALAQARVIGSSQFSDEA